MANAIPAIPAARRGQRRHRTYVSTGVLTADTLIFTGSGLVGGFVIIDDGAEACTVEIKDGTTTGGTTKLKWVSAGDGAPTGWENIECEFSAGIYLDVTTAGSVEVIVLYLGDK